MLKNILVYIFIISIFSTLAHALEGINNLENKLFDTNQDLGALQKQVDVKKYISGAAASGFYPTLSAVGGWAQNKTDEFSNEPSGYQRGYLGYVEGRLNLFKGFRDESFSDQKEIDFKLAELDLEQKKRELRLELTQIVSDMILLHKYQAILDEEYKVAQNQRNMATKKVNAGLTGQVDNIEMDLRESEIKIELTQIKQQHAEAHENLMKIFGSNIDDSELVKIDFSNQSILKSNQTINLENSIQVKQTVLLEEKANFEKREVKSDFLPSLDFLYSFGRLTPSEEQPLKLNEYKYGVVLTIPLFSGFDTYYKTKAANFHLSSASKTKLQKRNEITATFNVLKQKRSELNELYQINEVKLVQLRKYFDLTLSEYKRGIKNSPDVVSATERFFKAQKRKYEILKDIELTQIKIENL